MEINFAKKAPEDTLKELVADYEQVMGETLGLADPVRLFLGCMAENLTKVRFLIDFTGKQNLLSYAKDEFLDAQGELRGVPRLSALPAQTTIKFTLKEAQENQILIPKQTQAATADGFIFLTEEIGKINAGDLECEIKASAKIPGKSGNEYSVGDVANILDSFSFSLSAVNTDKPSGGC